MAILDLEKEWWYRPEALEDDDIALLKNALEWTGRLNNIRACAREIVGEEIIYT